MGQSKEGMSSLCTGLLCVSDRHPKVRPWKAPWNDSILSGGDPGARGLHSSTSQLNLSCF
jgi:hypothetical protein